MMKLKLILTTAIVGAALALPSVSSAASASATQPTLSMERRCDILPPLNGFDATLSGLPPFTDFVATEVTPEGAPSSTQYVTDASGSFYLLVIGTHTPGTFEVTVVWAGGTLTQSLFIDCTKPGSKKECQNGGWQNSGFFPQFKNQGQCIAFVNQGR
jgi:hypothetical protein